MYDMHYDLLTYIYKCKLDNNLDEVVNFVKNYNIDNVKGLIANLSFMSIDEMKNEFHPNYNDKSVVEIFKESTSLLESILPSDIDCIYSLEGCDYIEISDLDKLKEMGLRVIGIVGNNKSKYAAGVKGHKGLTDGGKRLVRHAIELNLAIDLSHANLETFYNTIDIIKEYRLKGYDTVCFVSHANSRVLCNRSRNLDDNQIEALKEVDGYIGVMANNNFILKDALKNNISDEKLRLAYMKHILYMGGKIGFDHVFLSSDDKRFVNNKETHKYSNIYDYNSIDESIRYDLLDVFDNKTINDIVDNNAKKVLKKIRNGK